MSKGNDDLIFNDDSFVYVPEVVESYTEEETDQALNFIKANDLPMSDLQYALKYVRISNRAVQLDGKFKELQERLKALREQDMVVVSPPKCGELDLSYFNKASNSSPDN